MFSNYKKNITKCESGYLKLQHRCNLVSSSVPEQTNVLSIDFFLAKSRYFKCQFCSVSRYKCCTYFHSLF